VELEVDGDQVMCHLHGKDGCMANQSSGSGEEQG
jgi:hypothetical protein